MTEEKVLAALRATHCDGTEVEIIRALTLAGILDPEYLRALLECERLLRAIGQEVFTANFTDRGDYCARIVAALAAVDKAREEAT